MIGEPLRSTRPRRGRRRALVGSAARARALAVGAVVAAAAVAGVAAVSARPAHAQRERGWDLRVVERVDVAAGGSAALTVALAVDRGLTVSRDAEVIIDLDAEPGLSVKKRRLGRRDAVDPDADAPRFAISLRGDAAGDHQLRLRVRFWLCGTRTCRPIDVRRVVTVAVAAASPTTGGGIDAAPRPPEPGRPRSR